MLLDYGVNRRFRFTAEDFHHQLPRVILYPRNSKHSQTKRTPPPSIQHSHLHKIYINTHHTQFPMLLSQQYRCLFSVLKSWGEFFWCFYRKWTQPNEIFDLQFFRIGTIGIFSILVKFLLRYSYSYFRLKKSDSPGFHPRTFYQKYKMQPFNSKIRIHVYFCVTVTLRACANVLKWLSTPRVMSDSPGSHTPGRFTQCSMIH